MINIYIQTEYKYILLLYDGITTITTTYSNEDDWELYFRFGIVVILGKTLGTGTFGKVKMGIHE